MLLLHLHPKMVPEEALAFARTFGLGGVALVLFVLLAATGALLLFAYEPSPERAYASVLELHRRGPVRRVRPQPPPLERQRLPPGGRAPPAPGVLHRRAPDPPRRANWLVGLALLLLVVAVQLHRLPAALGPARLLGRDHRAPACSSTCRWPASALLRAARGGAEIGPPHPAQFFVLHVAILPPALLCLMLFHFWLVRKAGGVIAARRRGAAGARPPLVPASPNLLAREGVAALVVLAAVLPARGAWSTRRSTRRPTRA